MVSGRSWVALSELPPKAAYSYLAGLIDGDGYLGRGQIRIYLHRDQEPVLHLITDFVGGGRIYKHGPNAVA
jgi:intein/homing endonuclease